MPVLLRIISLYTQKMKKNLFEQSVHAKISIFCLWMDDDTHEENYFMTALRHGNMVLSFHLCIIH